MQKKSLFIVIEGLDGSGKTSASRAVAEYLNHLHPNSVKNTFEPHDESCGGQVIRDILTKKITAFDPNFLPLAFATNRLDHCTRVIKPWLSMSEYNVVLCDRFYLSSLVYQSDENRPFEKVMDLNQHAMQPDVIFFINVDAKTCYERMKIRNQPPELFEQNLGETRQKYFNAIAFLKETRKDNIIEIDGSGTIEDVAQTILNEILILAPHLKGGE